MRTQQISVFFENASMWVKNFPDRAKTAIADYGAKSSISLPLMLNDFYGRFGKSNEAHSSKMERLPEPLQKKIKASSDILMLTGVLAVGVSVLLLCFSASLFTSLCVSSLIGLGTLLLLNHKIINTEQFKTEFRDKLDAMKGQHSSFFNESVTQVGLCITRMHEGANSLSASIKEIFFHKEGNYNPGPSESASTLS